MVRQSLTAVGLGLVVLCHVSAWAEPGIPNFACPQLLADAAGQVILQEGVTYDFTALTTPQKIQLLLGAIESGRHFRFTTGTVQHPEHHDGSVQSIQAINISLSLTNDPWLKLTNDFFQIRVNDVREITLVDTQWTPAHGSLVIHLPRYQPLMANSYWNISSLPYQMMVIGAPQATAPAPASAPLPAPVVPTPPKWFSVSASGRYTLQPGVEYNLSSLKMDERVPLLVAAMMTPHTYRFGSGAYQGLTYREGSIASVDTNGLSLSQAPDAVVTFAGSVGRTSLMKMQTMQWIPDAGTNGSSPVVLETARFRILASLPYLDSSKVTRLLQVRIASAIESTAVAPALPAVEAVATDKNEAEEEVFPEGVQQVIDLMGDGDATAIELVTDLMTNQQRRAVERMFLAGLRGTALAQWAAAHGTDWRHVQAAANRGEFP